MSRPENVGVIAADVYFPSTYVPQSELEKFDGVKEGKYTLGLGQEAMAVCDSREDINSICLTVVHSIMDKYNIPWDQIGRLEVGTETLVDKSKSVKSTLMQLFEARGCHDIEGVDTINACYGGTSALFNALAWTESSAWDGRYALVIAADIAVYDRGAARPTGGVGAVAMLVGPDAPLVIEPGLRGTHMEHAFDFYKPQMVSEYPTVDGHLSNACYIRALDNCYHRYATRFQQRNGHAFCLDKDVDYAIFHQPYAKLVQKSWARLTWNDYVLQEQSGSDLEEFLPLAGTEESMSDRALEKASMRESEPSFDAKVAPSMALGKQVGNSYCGSLYNGMASLIDGQLGDLPDVGGGGGDKRVLMFSYGSGLAASMFSVKVRGPVGHIKYALDLKQRLASRVALTPGDFHETVDERERNYTRFGYAPESSVAHYFPGTYYLDSVDDLHRRTYARVPADATAPAAGGGGSSSGARGGLGLGLGGGGGNGVSTPQQRLGARGMFTTARGAAVDVADAVADPFNMCLGDHGPRGNAGGNSARGIRRSSTVADPFNMDGSDGLTTSMNRVDTARNIARALHTKPMTRTRQFHTAVRSVLRYLK